MQNNRRRGAAVVELALVSPWLIVLMFIGVWLTELALSKLKLQECARSALWQQVGAMPDERHWPEVRAQLEQRAKETPPLLSGLRAFNVSIQRGESPMPYGPLTPSTVPSVQVDRFLAQGVPAILMRWGKSRPGKMVVDARAQLENPTKVPWSSPGVDALEWATLDAHEVIWADDGHLEDGSDVALGAADNALYRMVKPLTYLGDPSPYDAAMLPFRALPLVPWRLPSADGTFVVSHGYRHLGHPLGSVAGQCQGIPGYVRATGTESGVQDFMTPGNEWLDFVHPQCFDTAPFRDVDAYPSGGPSAGNLPMQVFGHRGPFFLGCQQRMAIDPSSSARAADSCETP